MNRGDSVWRMNVTCNYCLGESRSSEATPREQFPEDWEGDCIRCHRIINWDGDFPEVAEDAICHECAWKELEARRKDARRTDYPTRGHLINRKATVGARIVELDILIPEVEKRSRKTPPKTLLAEKGRVEAAKAMLPKLVEERDELMLERVELEAKIWNATTPKRSDGT